MNDKHKLKVLCVEDEKDIRSNYVEFLKTRYEDVYETGDGESAYAIYLEKKPDILLVDINIPKLNGIELIKKIRETDHTSKIIILSAQCDVNTLLSATDLKLTRYLIKPITRKALKEALMQAHQEFQDFKTNSIKKIRLRENYFYDLEKEILYKETIHIVLTKNEHSLFHTLILNKDSTLTYEDLIAKIWEYDEKDKSDSLKTLVKNLRKKLPNETIKTIFGIGYQV